MDHSATLPWTDEQWAMLNRLAQDTARNTRIAGSFLPLEGPLPPDQAFVPAMAVEYRDNAQVLYPIGGAPLGQLAVQGRAAERVEIDGSATLPLVRTFCSLEITVTQAQDPELAAVKQLLTRAADVIGRLEDEIVFNGLSPEIPGTTLRGRLFARVPPPRPTLLTRPGIYVVNAPVPRIPYQGLLQYDDQECGIAAPKDGPAIVSAVVRAIEDIEGRGYSAPFACVLGTTLFARAVDPGPGLILPSDRVMPLLKGGPFSRSTSIEPDIGVIIGLGGAPIDLVIGSDLELKYLGRSENAFMLAVSERFRLRIKDSFPSPVPGQRWRTAQRGPTEWIC